MMPAENKTMNLIFLVKDNGVVEVAAPNRLPIYKYFLVWR